MAAKQIKQGTDRIFIAVEGSGKKHRQELLPAYKAQRSDSPGLPLIQGIYAASVELLSVTRCEVVEAPEGEADDAVAAIVKRAGNEVEIRIISEDRDLWQLIRGDRVIVHTKRYGAVNEARCLREMGVPPAHVSCYKAFAGDTSDNVPRGVPRMRTSHIKQMAALDTEPGRAYGKAVMSSLLSESVLARVVKYKERIKTNYAVVRLRAGLQIKRVPAPTGRTLRDYLHEWQLDVDPETVKLLTGHRPT